MKYCQFCGTKLLDPDLYCYKCGNRTNGQCTRYEQKDWQKNAASEKEPMDKICCELAYAGTLFWLPLMVCPNHKYARYCANQGLWILLLAIAACTSIRILGAVNSMFSGNIIGAILGGVYSFAFILFLFFMIYLLWHCIKSAMAIHKDEEPESILFFETVRIIR